jgi:transcriptional regulator with XRE-family HTH domain
MSVGQRIREARTGRGWSQAKLAEAIGKTQTAVTWWENGGREPSRADVAHIACALEIDVGALELGEQASGSGPRGYPHIGKVGAGGSGDYQDDYALGEALGYIEPLPGMPVDQEIIVLDVDGDSMVPAVFDGDLAFFGPIRKDVEALLNKRVMARLADGRKFFKILKRGTQSGLYTLRSLNPATPDIEDVRIDWVLPYRGSRPRE